MTRAELLKIAKPMLFNTEMVSAILENRKTVTRRCVKLPKWIEKQNDGTYTMFVEGTCYEKQRFVDIAPYLNKPYRPGDILYVRETWSEWTGGYLYKAWHGPFPQPGQCSAMKWHPSLHMPKEAARIFLKVKGVRLERLQDITEEQAIKEGCQSGLHEYKGTVFGQEDTDEWTAREAFHSLWNSTLGRKDTPEWYANNWSGNPWVWVIEFEQITLDDV